MDTNVHPLVIHIYGILCAWITMHAFDSIYFSAKNILVKTGTLDVLTLSLTAVGPFGHTLLYMYGKFNVTN